MDDDSLPDWNDVSANFTKAFPDLKPDDIKAQYNAARQDTTAKAKIGSAYDYYLKNADDFWGPGSASYTAERIPGVSAIETVGYYKHLAEAADNIQAGAASDDDHYLVAQHLAKQTYQSQRGVAGGAFDLATRVPGFVGEYIGTGGIAGGAKIAAEKALGGIAARYLGGRVVGALGTAAGQLARTAAMPSTLGAIAERTVTPNEEGNLQTRSLPEAAIPAFGMQFMQNLVLGSLGNLTSGIANPVGRFAAGVGVGYGEMRGVEVAASALDQVLPTAYQTKTRFGVLGDALRGEWGEAAKRSIADLVTLSAFQFLHGRQETKPDEQAPATEPTLIDNVREKIDEQAKKGFSREEAVKQAVRGVAHDILGVEPGASFEDIQKAFRKAALATHPDRGGNPADFMRAKWAFETLTGQKTSPEPPSAPPPEEPQAAQRPPEAPPEAQAAPEAPQAPQPAPEAPQAQQEPPTPREKVDSLQTQLYEAEDRLQKAQETERRERQNKTMGLANKATEAAQERRTAQKEAVSLRQELSDARDTLHKAEAAPTAPDDRVARMRAKQQGMAPQAPRPGGPEAAQAPRPPFVPQEPHEPLDPNERAVWEGLRDAKSFGQIAKTMMNPKTGKPYSRSRAHQIAGDAMEKMGVDRAQVEKEWEDEALARAEVMARNGKVVTAAELHADPEVVAGRASDALDNALDDVADQFLKEAQRGKLSPAERADFEQRFRKLVAARRESVTVPDASEGPQAIRPSEPGSVQASPAEPPEQATNEPAAAHAESEPAAPQPKAAGNQLKPKSILDLVQRSGGIKKSAAQALGWDVGQMTAKESGLTGIFQGREKGRLHSGTRDPSELADELRNEGHLRWDDASENGHEVLRQAILNRVTIMDKAAEEGLARTEREYQDGLEEARRNGHSAQVATEALQLGKEAGQADSPSGDLEEGHERLAIQGEHDAFPDDPGTDPWRAADLLSDIAFGQEGYLSPQAIAKAAQAYGPVAMSALRYFKDAAARLGGKSFPTTSRFDREAGERLATLSNVDVYASLLADDLADKVLGDNSTPEFDKLFMTYSMERRHRYAKEQYAKKAQGVVSDMQKALAAGDTKSADAFAKELEQLKKASDDIVSFVGGQGSPIATEADYGALHTNAEVQQAWHLWERHLAPVMDSNFRRSLDKNETDPINAFTQIPGHPINEMPLTDTSQISASTVQARGVGGPSLKNLRLKRNPFAVSASLSAEHYEMDARKVIAHSITRGTRAAVEADAVRGLVKAQLATFGLPGKTPEGTTEIPGLRPPPSSQRAARGETSFYVDNQVVEEFTKAKSIGTVEDYKKAIGYVASVFNTVQLASLVDATTHGGVLSMSVFAPGIHPGELFKNIYDRVWNYPKIREKLVELARINAQKPPGLESGLTPVVGNITVKGWHIDPTYYLGKGMHVWNDVMRATLSEAHDRLVRRGQVKDTDASKRDFVNQWTGQYNKRAQNGFIAWLRDTKLGPFGTAASQSPIRAVKLLGAAPSVKATSWKAALMLRAEVFAKLATLIAAGAAYNYLRWGRVDGDEDAPFGSLKISEGKYFDLLALLQVKRGLRTIGLLAQIEGNRLKHPQAQRNDKSIEDMMHALTHPSFGPAVGFAWTTATGKDLIGRQVAEEAAYDESQKGKNFKAAMEQANPTLAAGMGWDQRPGRETPWNERVAKMLGPLGFKYRDQQPPEASNLHRLLHSMEDEYTANVRAARNKGLAYPQPPMIHVLREAVTTINKIELNMHKPDVTPERKAELRALQKKTAQAALDRYERVKAR